MKRIYLFFTIALCVTTISCKKIEDKSSENNINKTTMSVISLSKNDFSKKVGDSKSMNSTWEFKGDKPVVIDFYADWCGPCKMMAPVLEEVAAEFSGKVDVYKVNIDTENSLADDLAIQSIPTFFFIKSDGTIEKSVGGMTKGALTAKFNSILE